MGCGSYWDNNPNPRRFISKSKGSYVVVKSGTLENGEKYHYYYGSFTDILEAIKCRDYWERLGFPEPPKKKKNPMRFIQVRGEQSYRIVRRINGERVRFGSYHVREYAQYVRDRLEECDWDKTQLDKIIDEYPQYYTESLHFFREIVYVEDSPFPWVVRIQSSVDGKVKFESVARCKRLEDALWERDLYYEYGDDYQSLAEDTRPNPYDENMPYYWLSRRPKGGLRPYKDISKDILSYAQGILDGIPNQEELAEHLGITTLTIRNHLKKYNTNYNDFVKLVESGENPLEVLEPPKMKIIFPDTSYHRSKNNYVYYSTVNDRWVVHKEINGQGFQFGTYTSESLAKKVSLRLSKCGWDKSQLKRIHEEIGHPSMMMSKRWVYDNKDYKTGKIRSWSVRHKDKTKKMINFGTYKDKRVAELVRDNLIQVDWDKNLLQIIRFWAEYDILMIDTCWRCKL